MSNEFENRLTPPGIGSAGQTFPSWPTWLAPVPVRSPTSQTASVGYQVIVAPGDRLPPWTRTAAPGGYPVSTVGA